MKPAAFLTLLLLCTGLLCTCQPEQEKSRHGNHLLGEKSPYLLQHAYNPVDWYPWGEEALSKATTQEQLIVLSIGYAACHWCHVMEEESFEDSTVASLMNKHFVSIKVDREERPDIDQVYMDAARVINGQGGWPLNAILLPDGRPVYATTYLPKEQWIQMLRQIQKLWEQDPSQLQTMADQVMQGIRMVDALDFKGSLDPFPEGVNESMAQGILSQLDSEKGGRIGAPKFPVPVVFEYLLHRAVQEGDTLAKRTALATLDHMARGGIYDHVGGGFARYATDEAWHVPHFEKMLYDNAQLISLYSHGWQVSRKEGYREVVMQSIAFAERELASPTGGFYSSLDADSEGEEGTYYTWTSTEIEAVLGTGNLVSKYFAISPKGNWEGGRNILYLRPDVVLKKQQLAVDSLSRKALNDELSTLLKVRQQRVAPSLDDKILCSWNALMLTAYCDAYRAFGEEGFRRKAIELAGFIDKNLKGAEGGLYRNYKDGSASIPGFLDDYALTIRAYIDLYEISFDAAWLVKAKSLSDYVHEHFKDRSTGLYFYTSDLEETLVIRKKELIDQVLPASNTLMAENLHRLGLLLYIPEYEQEVIYMLNTILPETRQSPSYYAGWASLLLNITAPYYEVAIVGKNFEVLRARMQEEYVPNAIYLGGSEEGSLDLLSNKLVEGETMVYVCLDKSCRLPVVDAEQALKLMKKP